MKRVLIYIALCIATLVIVVICTTPVLFVLAMAVVGLAALVAFLWHCAGNLARGRLEEEP